VIEYYDLWYRTRIQSLQAVDELVDNVAEYLSNNDLLENTYIFYTSDNGFHIGQHRLQPGKTCAFEEDINVPFYARDLGVEAGRVVDLVTTHTDIVPTSFELAGIPLRQDFDGRPIPVIGNNISEAEKKEESWSEHVNVEFWGVGVEEGNLGGDYDSVYLFEYYTHAYKKLANIEIKGEVKIICTKHFAFMEKVTISCALSGVLMSMNCMI
jgi:N-acetylglucosamine-6-sulfatase